MAIAYTIAINHVANAGDQRVMTVTITAPAASTYATGGDTITAAQFGLDVVDFISFQLNALVDKNAIPGYTASSGAFKLYGTGAADDALLVEVDGIDVSSMTWVAQVWGVA